MQEINSIEDLLKYAPESDDPDSAPVFRGQEKRHPLIPSIGRPGHSCRNYKNWQVYEQAILRFFEREARAYREQLPTNVLDMIVLAQHHGVPTRLLDWTKSALIALYFAVEKLDQDADGAVWSFVPSSIRFKPPQLWIDLYEIKQTTLYHPPRFFDRVASQQACLTIHPLPSEADDFPKVDDEVQQFPFLGFTEFVVPAKSKFRIKEKLDDLGINRQSVYPGLDGVAETIKWKMFRIRQNRGDSSSRSVRQKLL